MIGLNTVGTGTIQDIFDYPWLYGMSQG